jgi:integrase
MSSKLPRYVMRTRYKDKTKFRYNPPQDAIDAGVTARAELGNKWQYVVHYAEAENKKVDEWRKEKNLLKNLNEKAKVSDLIESYKQNISFTRLRRQTQKDYLIFLRQWYDSRLGGTPLLNTKLGDITTPMCQRVYEEYAESSVSFANHSLAVYRLLFNYGIRQGFTNFNPFSKVLKRQDKKRKVVWDKENVKEFLDYAYGSVRYRSVGLIVQMAYEWGQRLGDMRTLEWSNYDLETGILNLEQSKRRAKITLPTSPELMEMLKQQHDDFGWQRYVAPSMTADRKGGLKPLSSVRLAILGAEVMKQLGFPEELKLMDLRRTAVTEMIEAEVPLPNIMAMTGHQTPQSVAPYLKHTLKGAMVAAKMRGFIQ